MGMSNQYFFITGANECLPASICEIICAINRYGHMDQYGYADDSIITIYIAHQINPMRRQSIR